MGTTDYQILATYPISEHYQHLLWLSFFFSFAIKIPIYPLHLW
jgi:NADH-quinone oxidoreductase subunit M